MSSHHPLDIDAMAEALFVEGQRIRDEWWASYVAGLNAYVAAIRSARQMSHDFGHLIPQPMTPEPPPVHHQGQPMPGSVPPPGYANGYSEDAEDRAFEQRLHARRNGDAW